MDITNLFAAIYSDLHVSELCVLIRLTNVMSLSVTPDRYLCDQDFLWEL